MLSCVLSVRLWSGCCCACSFAGFVATMNDMYVDAKKTMWPQRHDSQCGDLCGMLPLVEGMLVVLVDHLHRSPGM